MLRVFIFVLVSTLLSSSAWAETKFKITLEQAQCIANNVDTYLGYGTDPVIIVPETCPNPPTNDELMAALAPQNSGAGLPTPKLGEGDKVLILLQAQIRCIRSIVQAGELTQTEDGLVELSLEDCVD